jgi:hypothetical protein
MLALAAERQNVGRIEPRMGPRTEELLTVLDELQALLRRVGERHWSSWVEASARTIRGGDLAGVEHLLSAYGGMGSFNDLFLHSTNGHEVSASEVELTNRELSRLRSRAWDLAQHHVVHRKQTFYAYVEGADLENVAEALTADLHAFVEGHAWHVRPSVVSQRRVDDPSLEPGDLPHWELGLNLALPPPDAEPAHWFEDVAAIATFCGQLNARYHRDFVLGVHFSDSNVAEDVYFVNAPSVDIDDLRQALG